MVSVGVYHAIDFNKVNDQERQELYSFLTAKTDAEKDPQKLHEIKNDLIDQIISQGDNLHKFGDLMIDIVKDETQHPMLRDYTVQYLSNYYRRRWSEGTEDYEPEAQKKTKGAIVELFNSQEPGLSGTTLVVYESMINDFPEFTEHELGKHAEKILERSANNSDNRMVALRYIPKNRKNVELISSILNSETEAVSVRLSAMNTLSKINLKEHPDVQSKFISFLSNAGLLKDLRLHLAAKSYAKKFIGLNDNLGLNN